MEISRGRKNGVSLEDLPEDCISYILSFTTVKDVCTLAAVCWSWRSAANADLVWEKMIIQRFGGKISKGFSSLSFPSKKHLYICVHTDHGTKTIWLDESTGKIGCMIPPRDLCILRADYDSYFEWVRPNERLEYVRAYDVWQHFKCSILSPKTHYTVSFIIRIEHSLLSGLDSAPFIFSVVAPDGVRMESARFLDDLEKRVENYEKGFSMTPFSQDENGLLKFVAGEFYLEEKRPNEGAKEITFSIKNTDGTFFNKEIWVEGVKIEPKH